MSKEEFYKENRDMKINEIKIVETIKEWTSQGKNHCPNDHNVSIFVREIIPYIEQLEKRVEELEQIIKETEV